MKTQIRQHSKTQVLTLSALMIALTAVCSWISIPVPGTPVPINLATFAVIIAGYVLGSRNGALAMAVFLMLGAAGAPVFHGFTGGLGIVMGPTGGFLMGYIALAFAAGSSRRFKIHFVIASVLGEAVLYAAGVAWFVMIMDSDVSAAVAACVLPFIPGDIIKIILAYIFSRRIDKILAL